MKKFQLFSLSSFVSFFVDNSKSRSTLKSANWLLSFATSSALTKPVSEKLKFFQKSPKIGFIAMMDSGSIQIHFSNCGFKKNPVAALLRIIGLENRKFSLTCCPVVGMELSIVDNVRQHLEHYFPYKEKPSKCQIHFVFSA